MASMGLNEGCHGSNGLKGLKNGDIRGMGYTRIIAGIRRKSDEPLRNYKQELNKRK
ncbi:hypothetical protein HanHA300_Chr14g0515161 [Helianthus annuus]|nr:hypothetical protein HanHA300_Chr14g0515161 [Helianthus annuus]